MAKTQIFMATKKLLKKKKKLLKSNNRLYCIHHIYNINCYTKIRSIKLIKLTTLCAYITL